VASQQTLFDRDSSLLVSCGLHVLRYHSAGAGPDYPVALVRPSASFEGVVQVISAPGCIDGVLERPGAAVVVRAEDNGKIQIGVKRSLNGSLEASFRLESIGVLSNDNREPPRAHSSPTASRSLSQIATASSAKGAQEGLLLAHVSRRGDVSFGANEWAGGPDTPSRIEGLMLPRSGREGLRTEIQVLSGSKLASWSEWVGEGVFAGTRGQNQPLLGVRMRLTGDQAHNFIVHAETLFLGSAILSKRGREVECVSQTGRDPLVGFRFEICPERRTSARPAPSAGGQDEHPRVRIFRANVG
jgi:hypothetical protein